MDSKENRSEVKKQKKIDSTLSSSVKKGNSATQSKELVEIMAEQMKSAHHIYRLKNKTLFISSLTAGLEIGFSFLLICTLYFFLNGKIDERNIYLLFSFFYPVGFLMVIMGRSLLFTEQTSILALPVLNNKYSFATLLRIWGVVILGNVTGGILFSFLVVFLGPELNLLSLATIEAISLHVVHYEAWGLFFSAVLAGWLMGLLSWLLSSANDSITRVFFIIVITGIIGFLGLHHSIVGNVEVFSGMLVSSSVTVTDYLGFMILALAGNAAGGSIFVALFKYKAFESNF